jgi:peptidoglycan/xylan/chitin deacetylase (PgdA/CDA1 family)
MKNYLFLFLLVLPTLTANAQKKISFTFDDGSLGDRPGYAFEDWNKQLLGHLDKAGVKAIFFVTGGDKTSAKGKYLLQSWSDKGHKIANHTLTHPNYNSPNVTFKKFRQEFLKNDSIIRTYKNYVRLFRFPYLKEGYTPEKVSDFRNLMQAHNYQNGYVTVDASDWYIDSRLVKRLKENPNADIAGFKKFYLEHIFERANFYEDLAFKLTGRHISHTLLLHHNLAAALFLDDLISLFREKGWEVISADKAYQDKIFQQKPELAGEGLIWALAKQSGKFENQLRYPAEDSEYEKDKMDKLGL